MTDRVGQQLGNYHLLRLLGQGAFAAVYLGEHQYLERPAAIKVLHVQMQPGSHEAFRREARTIAQLQHPHIIGVHDFGIEGQTPYLVMEYTPNGTLRSRHPRGTRLSFEQIIGYVKQIASALDYAHEQRVIHRDIKPENILLGAKHEVILSDFGLAVVQRTLDSLSTQDPAGTPVYMAPEQIQRKPCAASDQYALGVMVYEWLCGEPPFRGFLYEVFNQHLHEPPPGLCARLPQLPPAVEDAVFGTLAKDPHQRFVRVADFATVLEEAFFATQPLSLRGSVEHGSPDQIVAPLARAILVPVPSLSEQDHSDEATQPRLGTAQRIEGEHEQVSSVFPQPAMHSQTVPKPAKPSLAQTNRQRLLRRVRSFWITGVFEQSLHGAALMALGLEAHPNAVANPWHLVVQHPETASEPLPTGTRITQVYDDADGELLILGAPGSGKTTLLLELARDLLERAEHDEQHPMPVVFNLSSWAMKQQPLVDWLVEELVSKYQVPRKLGQTFIDADQILPLLDGLDEVAPKSRTACIEAINRYREVHGLLPLVVCSRSADYLAQTTRVLLRSAVAVQPLTEAQVDDYLASGGEPLWALRVALHQDTTLRELTGTPLMLSILTLTYHGKPVEDLLRGITLQERQRQVFEQYVGRMLIQRGPPKVGTPQQIVHWLSYLARQIRERNQTVFYLEHLQPDWLATQLQFPYTWLAIRIPAMFIGALTCLILAFFLPVFSDRATLLQYVVLGGFLGGLLSYGERGSLMIQHIKRHPRHSPLHALIERTAMSAFIGLMCGLSFGVSLGPDYGLADWLQDGSIFGGMIGLSCWMVLSVLPHSFTRSQPSSTNIRGWWALLRRWMHTQQGQPALIISAVLGGGIGLSHVLSIGQTGGPDNWLNNGLVVGPSNGLSSGLLFGLTSVFTSLILRAQTENIHLIERLRWTRGSLIHSLLASKHLRTTILLASIVMTLTVLSNGLSTGLTDWLNFGLLIGLHAGLVVGLSIGLSYGLSYGLCYWLLLGLYQGIAHEQIEDQDRRVFNQGIRRSFRNSAIMGLISGGVIGAIGLPSEILSYGLSNVLLFGSDVGLRTDLRVVLLLLVGGGLLAGAISGGLAVLRHAVIRLLLWRTCTFPWQAEAFLEDAATRCLMRRVGGGYIFVHRLLLEYFASLDTTSTSDATKCQGRRMYEPIEN